MKKSKTIKLVLIASLTMPGLHAKSNAHFKTILSPFGSKLNPAKVYTTATNIYNLKKDSMAHSSAAGNFAHVIITRGGWGFFGHHNSITG